MTLRKSVINCAMPQPTVTFGLILVSKIRDPGTNQTPTLEAATTGAEGTVLQLTENLASDKILKLR